MDRLTEWYLRWSDRLRAYAMSRGIPADDAEALVHDIFLSILAKEREIKNPERWLFGAMTLASISYWRDEERYVHDEKLLEREVTPRYDTSAEARQFLQRLPKVQRRIVVMAASGVPMETIARRIGFSVSWTEKLLRRAREAAIEEIDLTNRHWVGDAPRRTDNYLSWRVVSFAPMYALYEVLLYLVLLIALPYFLLTGVLRGKYVVNFPVRAGWFRHPAEAHDLWIHAVSVGETLAARPIVEEIARQRPGTSIVFTTTTLTGQAQARRLYPEATVTYFPFDFAFSVKRFLEHHRPRAFATMETEIWPNVTRLARAKGLRLLLANGRISDRSFPRYRAFRWVVGPLLRKYDRILAREATDRDRFVSIGAPAEIVEVSGNVKFDYEPDETPLEIAPQLEALMAGRKMLVFGSTMQGEDEALLPEIEALIAQQNVFVVIAPRKPERFELVAGLLATSSLRFMRRSELTAGPADVLLLDTFGELAKVYRYATAAFIGGTLVPIGGHNPIEAAAAGVPVCFGPSMTNFREIAQVFLRNEAAVQVRTPSEAAEFLTRMLEQPDVQRLWGERGRETVLQNRGASARTARRIVELLA